MNKKKYWLFLDDIRNPIDVWKYTGNLIFTEKNWKIVRSYSQFVDYIQINGMPELISFDHDLSEEHYRPSMYDEDKHYSKYYTDGTFTEKTGYDCAKWLVDYCMDNNIKLPEFYVHSMNPVGKENILKLFENFKKHNYD